MAHVEYSKIVRIPVTSVVNGFSTDITLPSSYSIGSAGGFINYYVAFGEYECGISTASGYSNAWRWFANSSSVPGTDAGGSFGDFRNGQTINISLQLLLDSGTTYKVKFYVNGVHRHTFSTQFTSSKTFTGGRVVVACAQHSWDTDNTTIPNPLPSFDIRHDQVVTFNTKYRNTSGTWVNVNSSNSSPALDKNPAGYTTPAPVNYTVSAASFGSGYYYASMKV